MGSIAISHLTRDYGKGRGVLDLSFEVNEGEAFGFLGPNGAGKTTTIRHLMGFLRPRSGSCSIFGLDCWRDRDSVHQILGYVPGEISFFDEMTGAEYLKFVSKLRRSDSGVRQKELLERFELDPSARIRKMSKGTRQKLSVVCAFMHDPQVLILDEPTSGLDPLMQNRFVELVSEEKRRGKTLLLSSHIFDEVERTCDRVGIIRSGRLIDLDRMEAMRARHVHSYTVFLETEQQAAGFAEDFGGTRNGRSVNVSSRQSLEEVFLHYYGGGAE